MNLDALRSEADVEKYWRNFSQQDFNIAAMAVQDFLQRNKDLRDMAIMRRGIIAKAAVEVNEHLVPVPLTREAWASLHGYGVGYPSAFEKQHGLRGSEV